MSLTPMMAALLVAAALGHVPDDANAMEPGAATERPDPVNIRMAKGKFSGKINNRPLSEVLDAIRGMSGFQYKADKLDLRYPVSGTFREVPLVDAVKKVLEPFNYVIIFDANG